MKPFFIALILASFPLATLASTTNRLTVADCEVYTTTDLGVTQNNVQNFKLNLDPMEESSPVNLKLVDSGVEFTMGAWMDWDMTTEEPSVSVQLGALLYGPGSSKIMTQNSILLTPGQNDFAVLAVEGAAFGEDGVKIVVACMPK